MGLAFPGGLPGFDPTHLVASKLLFSGISTCNQAQVLDLLTGRKAGTTLGVPTSSTDGVIGPSISGPAGSNAGFNFTNYAANCPVNQPFALGCMIRTPSTFATSAEALVGYGAEADAGGFYLRITQTTGTLGSTAPAGTAAGVSSFALVTNTPYFVAASSDAVGVTNYLALNLATGQIFTATSTKTASAASANGTININEESGRGMYGSASHWMITLQYQPMAALLQWAADPWPFWYPQK